ncbi:hypothetical protein KJ680_14230, partial [bacterium]|nr:hypothetical protein [bacterium]
FALVNIENYGYNFEAEILTDEKNQEEAKNKIKSKLDELGLNPFNEEELNEQCNNINNNKELQYDFSKTSFEEIKKGFEEFF